MTFNWTLKQCNEYTVYNKLLFKLKLTLILLVAFTIQLNATSGFSQITLNEKAKPLAEIIPKIKKQSGYDFFYSSSMLDKARPVTVKVTDASVEDVLKICFANQQIAYSIEQKAIVLTPLDRDDSSDNLAIRINGKILDENGKPLPDATVKLKGAEQTATISAKDGSFSIIVPSDNHILLISYLGYKTKEVKLKGVTMPLIISLELGENTINDIVVTGMFQRKKESFTGATANFSGDQLKALGNQNIIQSLRTLDPSFIQIENNALGSNPNILPTIELRGQTSISIASLRDQFSIDPNQPLFILDGFETSLRTIIDLDMNQVASVSILKDASSTAIYGSRAANGVIVVETKKPLAGKLRVSYTSDAKVELPDLSSYNMMNATEKLEFERLAGRYTDNSGILTRQLAVDEVYNNRLKEVQRGVNTYWLGQPLQTGFSHRHSVSASGGNEIIRYDLGANVRKNAATMIGEKRDDWGANLNLSYRSGIINVSNRVYVSGVEAAQSPYGSYALWVRTNPYYRLMPANEKYLEVAFSPSIGESDLSNGNELIPNPLYNASLNSFNKSSSFNIINNFQANADLSRNLRLQLNAQINKSSIESSNFLSPLNTQYDNISDPTLKGRNIYSKVDGLGYNVNLNLAYSKIWVEKHALTGNMRVEAAQNNMRSNGYTAVGFPNASNGNPAFSYGYEQGSSPNVASSPTRRNSWVTSLNYSYDQRYNIDLNFNIDGSTAFGSNKRYKPYYSGGISWNLHNEAFLKRVDWVNLLKLRGNIGVAGNQNFGNVSQSVYNYYSSINSLGQGIYLSALGAPDLEWQSTQQISLGLDANLFNNRFNVQLNAYRKYTDPMVVAINLPPSTGLSSYPFNAGASTIKGMEMNLNFSPVYQPGKIVWTIGLTGSMLTQRFSKFDNKLATLNEELRRSNSLVRYRDGYSSYDIWAVPSLGIDPATGKEVFLRKDGQHTFEYDPNGQQVVGSSRPRAEGVVSTTLRYKGFTFGAYVRYLWHQKQLNSALYNKVENLSYAALRYNQDKRALYDRWKKPGDVSQFKDVSLTAGTPISSRFIQTENSFSGESINLGYEFREQQWLNKLSLSALSLTAYSNDVFFASNIRRERGIDYPFSRSISFSLRATFK